MNLWILLSHYQNLQLPRNNLGMKLRAALHYVFTVMTGLCFTLNPRDLSSLTDTDTNTILTMTAWQLQAAYYVPSTLNALICLLHYTYIYLCVWNLHICRNVFIISLLHILWEFADMVKFPFKPLVAGSSEVLFDTRLNIIHI